MATRYDVFAKIVERAPCRMKDLDFKSPVYAHVSSLKEHGWIQAKKGLLLPVKNQATASIFKVIRYCLNHGLDYNIFFTGSMRNVLKHLPSASPSLRPVPLRGNKEVSRALRYLESNQFILKYSSKPALGRLLRHQVLDHLSVFFGLKVSIKDIKRIDLMQRVLQIKAEPVNPFERKVFSFLAGSVQLEGSTITEGDTMNLLLKEIYPDKPAKDIQMVKNLNEALKYVLENKDSGITTAKIKEINKLVMFSLLANAGKYKVTQNKIQGNPSFKTAMPGEVPKLMEEFCEDMGKIKTKEECLGRLGSIHNQLQRIHPFTDGNSRTTRVVLNWLLMKHELPIVVLRMGSFDEYMSLTKLSRRRDDELLNRLFLELIVHENLSS